MEVYSAVNSKINTIYDSEDLKKSLGISYQIYESQNEVFPTQRCLMHDIETRCPKLSGTAIEREFGETE